MAQATSDKLTDVERDQLRAIVAECHGVAGAARHLGVSRGALTGVLAGTGSRRGTVELVRAVLKARRK